MSSDESAAGSVGPSTDRHNEPVIDPTRNVLDLVSAAIERQDDLRELEAKQVREIIALRAEVSQLRANYDHELREAEAARIDAIRAVDVGAVNRAAEVAATQAATLAAQVSTSAETLRNQVAAAAQAQTVALAAALEPIIKDIADLRRAQYEALGQKAQVVETRGAAEDLAPVYQALADLKAGQAENRGARAERLDQRAGVTFAQGLAASAIGFFALILAAIGLYLGTRGNTTTPQIVPVTVTTPTGGTK